ncbi:uncharacterized protein LOC143917690 [Arctopsyche grandis]|uniref:uncharacterized protein LOC143917690 n=1 Tax=Arctopsyche grandis TaxID=121162 RepID=UPI00406D6F01
MHQKEDILNRNFENEKEKCKNLEEIIHEKNVQFHEYVTQLNMKISFLNFVIQVLKEQYHNAIPLYCLDNLWDTKTELQYKLDKVQDREKELDFISVSLEKNGASNDVKAILEEFRCTSNESQCHHYIEMKLNESQLQFNNSVLTSKLNRVEEENKELVKKLSSLSDTLLIFTFTFNKSKSGKGDIDIKNIAPHIQTPSFIELMDIDAEVPDDHVPVPKPRTIIKNSNTENKLMPKQDTEDNLMKFSAKNSLQKSYSTTVVQTEFNEFFIDVSCQTDVDETKNTEEELMKHNEILQNNLEQSLSLASKRAEEILNLRTKTIAMETKIKEIEKIIDDKNNLISSLSEKLESNITKPAHISQDQSHVMEITNVLENIKKIETQKDFTIEKYKDLLNTEKAEHNQTRQLAEEQIVDFKIKMESLEKEYNSFKKMFDMKSDNDSKDKTESKLLGLEEQCFHLKKDLDHKHASMLSLKFECERWKNLAAERFSNMEMLKKQLEEMHTDEVISYKSEAAHWLNELRTAKNDLNDVKLQLNEQRTSRIKEMSEKNSIIDKVQDTNNYLKQQLLNLQAIISERDPTFDLSTIIASDDSYFDVETFAHDSFKVDSMESVQRDYKNSLKSNRSI